MKKCLFMLAVVLLLSACSLFDSGAEKVYFNIGEPNPADTVNMGIIVNPFKSELPFGKKMSFITSKYSVTFDNCNQWELMPDVMVTDYFTVFLNDPAKDLNGKTNNKYILNGRIIRFVCYSSKPEILLQIRIRIQDKTTGHIVIDKIFTRKNKFKNLTADSFAETMSQAMNNICLELANKILALNNSDTKLKK